MVRYKHNSFVSDITLNLYKIHNLCLSGGLILISILLILSIKISFSGTVKAAHAKEKGA